jgi:hypothetical protein
VPVDALFLLLLSVVLVLLALVWEISSWHTSEPCCDLLTAEA